MRRLSLILPLLLVACGGEAPAVIAATVRIDALLKDEVKSLNLFALGPQRSDGIMLTCTNLVEQVIAPDDARVEGLAKAQLAFSDPEGRSVTLDDVASGKNRVVYVAGKGINGTLIANGCTEYITVSSGETTTIEVDLWRL